MNDYYINDKVYRIVTWNEYPRQVKEFCIIVSNYDEGEWEDVIGFDTLKEAQKFLKNKEEKDE
jgi:hypothetical protein